MRMRNWLTQWVDGLAERWLDKRYEGPEPPRRLTDEVRMFRVVHPTATPRDWAEFAAKHGRNCYRDGYVRGYEYKIREDDPDTSEAELLDNDAKHDAWAPSDDPEMNQVLVQMFSEEDPLGGATPDERREFNKMIKELQDAGVPLEIYPDGTFTRKS